MCLPERFLNTLKRERLILPGDRVGIACSGGPDSVALVHLLEPLRKSWKLRLVLLHVDHGLRGKASGRDARFVKKLAARLKIPFHGTRLTAQQRRQALVKSSPEEGARDLRYQALGRIAARHRLRKLALAHTQDDQAETILMRVLQGTGLRGLSGIRRSRRMGRLQLIRPLLSETKENLLGHLKKNRIVFCRDRSNGSRRFLRNRIRLDLLPQIRSLINPRVVQALSRIPEIIRDENELLAALEERSWHEVFLGRKTGKVSLNREVFVSLPPALQFRLLDRALKALDARSGLSYENWVRLRPGLTEGRVRVSLPRSLDLSLTPLSLVLCKKNNEG